MAEASDKEGILYQNLVDAGCSKIMIQSCMRNALEGNRREMRSSLEKHRASLLKTIHKNQKRIDCLDFLLYQMEKQEL